MNDREHLALAVRMAWAALDDVARADAPRVEWRDVRFVGEYDGRVVDGPTAAAPIEWQRAALRALRAGDLPRSCLPVIYRGETWAGVHPSRIDWTGYRHAGGDPRTPARTGSAVAESDRSTVQVNARVPRSVRAAYEREAAARGVSLGALVREQLESAEWARERESGRTQRNAPAIRAAVRRAGGSSLRARKALGSVRKRSRRARNRQRVFCGNCEK